MIEELDEVIEEEFKLQIGKQYVMRNGEITPPLEFDSKCGTNYKFEAWVQEKEHPTPSLFYWLKNGIFLTKGVEHKYDIIKEHL
jgi:hypothetical protein